MKKPRLQVFGGIQVICIGDFGQLGPIATKLKVHDLKKVVTDSASKGKDPAEHLLGVQVCSMFAFQSVFWGKANFKYITLEKNFHHNESLKKVMKDLRYGRGDTAAVMHLVK